MSTVQPTDKTLVNRAGVDHSAPADMSTVKDTDLLLINRAGVDYKCTFADWKNSQTKAPDVGAVTLADVAGGARFTSTAFPVSATMTDDGTPTSTKKLKAYVEGTLKSSAQTSLITNVAKTTGSVTIPLTPSIRAVVGTLEVGRGVERAFDADMRTDCSTSSGTGLYEELEIDFGHVVPLTTLRVCGQTQGSLDFDVYFDTTGSTAYRWPCGWFSPPIFTSYSGSQTLPTSFQKIRLKSISNNPVECGVYIFAIELNGVWIQSTSSITVPADTTTLTLTDATGLSGFANDDKVTETGNGDDGTGIVSAIDAVAVPPTITLYGASGTWDVDSAVKGPLKAPAGGASVKLYCKLDAAGAVSDLQSADPGFTAWTPAGTGPYTGTVTFPATLPTGNAPDADLPAGTTLTVEVQASNTAGTDSAKSNTVTPA